MKIKFSVLNLIFAFSLFSLSAFAKEKTDSVKVLGNCESCKSRIEKAAKQAGAVKADWNEETGMLTVAYDDVSTSLLTIEKKIASVGHDTRDVKAATDVYDKLHSCCQYDRTGLSGAKSCDHEEETKKDSR